MPWQNSARLLTAGLYPAGQRPEVGDSLQFVVGKLDVEVMFQPGKQVQRLQAVDPQSLEKIIVGSEPLPRHFELRRREIQYFFERSLSIWHVL